MRDDLAIERTDDDPNDSLPERECDRCCVEEWCQIDWWKCEGELFGEITDYDECEIHSRTGELYLCPECKEWFRPENGTCYEASDGRFLCGIFLKED